MPLGFATGLSLNQPESQPVQSNQDENNYGRQQMMNGQCIKMSVNDLWSCTYGNSPVTWSMLCITDVLAAYIGKRDRNTVTAPFLA
jgi:hypothetical protein